MSVYGDTGHGEADPHAKLLEGRDHPLHSVNRRKQAFVDKYRSLKNDLDSMNAEYKLPMSRVPDDHKPLRGKVGVPGKKKVSILDGPIQEEDKSETILQLKVRKLQNNVKTTEGKFDNLVDEYKCNRKDIRMRANKPKPRSMAVVVYEDPRLNGDDGYMAKSMMELKIQSLNRNIREAEKGMDELARDSQFVRSAVAEDGNRYMRKQPDALTEKDMLKFINHRVDVLDQKQRNMERTYNRAEKGTNEVEDKVKRAKEMEDQVHESMKAAGHPVWHKRKTSKFLQAVQERGEIGYELDLSPRVPKYKQKQEMRKRRRMDL
ncbi:uncharacterized protein [Branchiostoma lanceolatum]|uniref:Hypp5167 protein n=1 Tax=Branchiostoma lanceolatum TaxID=7740 RepID=A0A8K0AFP3_BRALA|nr:Hypp5167 [Branchiostoma lanceolatum]